MAITLTCTCGRKQTMPHHLAGRTFACVGCGKALTVPAMGLPANSKPRPSKTSSPERRSNPTGIVLIVAGILVLMIAGGGLLAWGLAREKENRDLQAKIDEGLAREKANRDLQDKIDELNKNVGVLDMSSGVDTRESKRSTSPQIRHEAQPPVPELLPPPTEKKDRVIEPVEPIDATPYIIEAIKLANDLPNMFAAPIKVAEKKPNVMEPLKLVWKLNADDTFYQELVVTQKPTFKVQGIAIVSLLQYGIVSRFRVTKINEDGSRVVEQKIESAKLLQADDLTKPLIADAVAQMVGKTFTLELSPKMDVTKFEGDVGGMKVAGGGMGLQMASLLDRDGWKELAQATFFQFDQPLKVKDTWSKPMTHNWGGLGSWSGKIHYRYDGKQQNLHRVAHGLQLAYKAPAAGAVGLMKVNGANFQTQQAEGHLLFDSVRGRVIGAEERFRVKGVINANLLGQNTQIEIEEDQHFAIRIHDKLP